MTDTAKASDIHPDVLKLAQQITDRVNDLVLGVESLDANNWLTAADDIDKLNSQLQSLIIPAPPASTTTTKTTTTKSNS